MNSRKIKNKKLNSIIIKSFIIIAVVMMLINVVPGEGAVNEKSKTYLDERSGN